MNPHKYINKELMRSKGITRELLYREYIINKKSLRDLSKEFNVYRDTVRKWLDFFDISVRLPKGRGDLLYKDREWLYSKYIIEDVSITDIAKLLSVSTETISYWIDYLGIPKKPNRGNTKNNLFSEIDLNEVIDLYLQGNSFSYISDTLGVSRGAVSEFIKNTLNIDDAFYNRNPLFIAGVSKQDLDSIRGYLRRYSAKYQYPVIYSIYTCCENCKSKENLNVHHIYPINSIIQDVYNDLGYSTKDKFIQDVISNEVFQDLDNLKVLCFSCHMKHHSMTK